MIFGPSLTTDRVTSGVGRCARTGDVLAIIWALWFGLTVELPESARAQANMGGHQPKSEGQRIYRTPIASVATNGMAVVAAATGARRSRLRDTQLNRDQIIEVVHCGRPGTGMPRHDRDAYKDYQCYGGLTAQDFGKDMPKEATNFLRPKEIETVVDWNNTTRRVQEQCIAVGSRIGKGLGRHAAGPAPVRSRPRFPGSRSRR